MVAPPSTVPSAQVRPLQVLVGPLQENAVLLYLLHLLYQAYVQRLHALFCLDLASGIGQQHQAPCELTSGS
jgi:hypothetical protein